MQFHYQELYNKKGGGKESYIVEEIRTNCSKETKEGEQKDMQQNLGPIYWYFKNKNLSFSLTMDK